MKLSITNSAFRDLESIKKYCLKEGVPHIGDEVISAIIEHIKTLEQHSDIGRIGRTQPRLCPVLDKPEAWSLYKVNNSI